jgi:hypothetical protein
MKSVPGIANGATYSASAGDEGRFVLGARVTPGHFKQTHEHPELRGCTLVESLHQHGLDGFEGTVIAVRTTGGLPDASIAFSSSPRMAS